MKMKIEKKEGSIDRPLALQGDLGAENETGKARSVNRDEKEA